MGILWNGKIMGRKSNQSIVLRCKHYNAGARPNQQRRGDNKGNSFCARSRLCP